MSSFLAGAEMITFLTEPRMCFLASSALVNNPVDSTTRSTPSEGQSIFAGSLSLKTRIDSPSTVTASALEPTVAFKLPSTESYFSKCASVFGSVMSLTATISMSLSAAVARNRLRPIRPNPLIPTLIVIVSPVIASNYAPCANQKYTQIGMYLIYTFLLYTSLVIAAPYYAFRFRRYLPTMKDRFGFLDIPRLR